MNSRFKARSQSIYHRVRKKIQQNLCVQGYSFNLFVYLKGQQLKQYLLTSYMSQPDIKIKIQFFGSKEPIYILLSSNKTFQDMKNELHQLTFINPWNQKILKNGEIIKVPDDSLLCDLNLKQDSLIVLLMKNDISEKDYTAPNFKDNSQQTTNIDKPAQQIKEQVRESVVLVEKPQGLTKEQSRVILKNIFKGKAWTERSDLLLSQQGFLQFVLAKLSSNYTFGQLILGEQKEIRKIILDEQCKEARVEQYKLIETYDTAFHRLLLQKGYQSEKVKEALHRSENNLAQTIQILESDNDKGVFRLQTNFESTEEELSFVNVWLNSQENRLLRIRVSLDQIYFTIYLNSLKFRCPPLFEVLLKHASFALQILKRQSPQTILKQEHQKVKITLIKNSRN